MVSRSDLLSTSGLSPLPSNHLSYASHYTTGMLLFICCMKCCLLHQYCAGAGITDRQIRRNACIINPVPEYSDPRYSLSFFRTHHDVSTGNAPATTDYLSSY